MFKEVKPKTIKEYLATVPEDRKEAIEFLHKFIQDEAPELKSFFAYNMLGYGKFKYTNYKKEEVDWPVVALANQKSYISIYVCALDGKNYVAEKFAKKLGKVSTGKSCIRIKKLEDLNLDAFKEVLKIAVRAPGIK